MPEYEGKGNESVTSFDFPSSPLVSFLPTLGSAVTYYETEKQQTLFHVATSSTGVQVLLELCFDSDTIFLP